MHRLNRRSIRHVQNSTQESGSPRKPRNTSPSIVNATRFEYTHPPFVKRISRLGISAPSRVFACISCGLFACAALPTVRTRLCTVHPPLVPVMHNRKPDISHPRGRSATREPGPAHVPRRRAQPPCNRTQKLFDITLAFAALGYQLVCCWFPGAVGGILPARPEPIGIFRI
jgi:hypothetical protein